jgi:uncharacterized protein (TIGR02246 family)
MESYLTIAAVISVALIMSACHPAPEQVDDVAVIKRLYEDWKAPWEAGDAAAVAAFYANDAIQMPANEPDVIGKDAWKVSLQAFFDQFTVKSDASEVLEAEVAGDLAFARGTYMITVTPKAGGKPTQYSGKFVHIFKRQPDGSWKIYRAIGVDDQSPPATGG